MCLSPALQSGEDIVSHQLELQSILHGVHQRYAGRQGRYNKHDTARLRYIKNTAFPGLRFGKMVPERDMAMLSPLPPSRIARHLASPQGHLSRRLHLSAGRQHPRHRLAAPPLATRHPRSQPAYALLPPCLCYHMDRMSLQTRPQPRRKGLPCWLTISLSRSYCICLPPPSSHLTLQ